MLFENAINSKKQGDIGMCYAMAYYAKLGWTVSIPVTDLLFALTDSGDCYSIPKSEISAVSSVALGERYLPYRVTLH